jgi:hypothetical protein
LIMFSRRSAAARQRRVPRAPGDPAFSSPGIPKARNTLGFEKFHFRLDGSSHLTHP